MSSKPSVTPRVDDFVANRLLTVLTLSHREEQRRWIEFASILELELMVANKRIKELEEDDGDTEGKERGEKP